MINNSMSRTKTKSFLRPWKPWALKLNVDSRARNCDRGIEFNK